MIKTAPAKKPENMVKEYVRRLADDDVKLLQSRCRQRLQGDAAEVLHLVARAGEIDRWLGSAKSFDEFFEMVDLLEFCVDREFSRRFQQAA